MILPDQDSGSSLGDGTGGQGAVGAGSSTGSAPFSGADPNNDEPVPLAPADPVPSCAGGLICAVNRSCCESLLVQGGTFPMGRSLDGTDACPQTGDYPEYCTDDELPEHPATVGDFYLDTFEVTVGRFRAFVAKYEGTPPEVGTGAHPRIAGSGWRSEWDAELPSSQRMLLAELNCSAPRQTWSDAPLAGREDYPVGCLTWYVAFAFCAWDHGRLPTEAEWEYAAAGGHQNRLFPWGNEDPRDNLDWAVHSGLFDGVDDERTVDDAAPVGWISAGRGRWGQLDLAGSIREWVLDIYDPGFYLDGPCDSCANLAGLSEDRFTRGGAYATGPNGLRAAYRQKDDPPASYEVAIRGVRCARDQ